MIEVLDVPSGVGGGAKQIARANKYPRSIIVTASTQDAAANHAVFFGHNRRQLVSVPAFGQGGIAIVVPSATPAAANPSFPVTDTINTGKPTTYTTFVFEGYAGELWAAADVTGKVQVDVFDSAAPES